MSDQCCRKPEMYLMWDICPRFVTPRDYIGGQGFRSKILRIASSDALWRYQYAFQLVADTNNVYTEMRCIITLQVCSKRTGACAVVMPQELHTVALAPVSSQN